MKKIIYLISLLIILSCIEKKNKELHISKGDRITPIFLNLNPKMSNDEFNKKIKENKELTNERFSIPLDGIDSDFSIYKGYEKIILTHYAYQLSNKKIYSSLFNLFKKKYGKPIKIPSLKKEPNNSYSNTTNFDIIYPNDLTKKTLKDYGFKQDNYFIFRDSIKTILISSSFLNKSKYAELSHRDIAEFSGDENSNKYSDEPRLITSFNAVLEIIYMYNSDFDKKTIQMIKDKLQFESKIREIDSLNKILKKKINNNKTKI